MEKKKKGVIHVLEFECQAALVFYEHCCACPRFEEGCPDLAMGTEILQGKKKISYNGPGQSEDEIDVRAFKCEAPVKYFEKTRKKCAHEGRCREEGLLLALLNGKKQLEYSQKEAVRLPGVAARVEKEKVPHILKHRPASLQA